MADATLTDASARALRRFWFTYLDEIQSVQTDLHGYCMKLTRNLWDAEDLVQDTVLRGFAMTARGDFHGAGSRLRNPKAYLFRTATNLWLDRKRRGKWEAPAEAATADLEASMGDSDTLAAADALTLAVSLTSRQEFAALLLKDVYAFTLEEVADFIGTTVGTVKSALGRARRKMREQPEPRVVSEATRGLVRALVDAMNARDVDRVMQLMSEAVKIDVCNVGGGRGRSGMWTKRTLAGKRFEYGEHDGAPLLLLFRDEHQDLCGVVRVEATGDAVTRLVDYHYAADTIRQLGAALGYACRTRGYHQDEELEEMLATTGLPWKDG